MTTEFCSKTMSSEEPVQNSWENPPSWNRSTTNHIIGGATFGLGVRMWQLGILKKPLTTNPIAHGLSMLGWGAVGYCVWRWDVRSRELIAEKKATILARQGVVKGL